MGLVAGLLGTAIQQGLTPVWAEAILSLGGISAYHEFYLLVGTLAVSLIAYLLLRPFSRNPGLFDLAALILVVAIAERVTVPLLNLIARFVSPLNPQAWTYLFGATSNGSGAIHPGIVVGAVVAAAFVVFSLLLGSALPRRRTTAPTGS